MSDDFDMTAAIQLQKDAKSALGPGGYYAARRLELFPALVKSHERAIHEIELRTVSWPTAVKKAYEDMHGALDEILTRAMAKYGRIDKAIDELRETLKPVRNENDGKYRWTPKDGNQQRFSDAFDRLVVARINMTKDEESSNGLG